MYPRSRVASLKLRSSSGGSAAAAFARSVEVPIGIRRPTDRNTAEPSIGAARRMNEIGGALTSQLTPGEEERNFTSAIRSVMSAQKQEGLSLAGDAGRIGAAAVAVTAPGAGAPTGTRQNRPATFNASTLPLVDRSRRRCLSLVDRFSKPSTRVRILRRSYDIPERAHRLVRF